MTGGKELGAAVELYERLQMLSCPCLEGVYLTDPQSIYELLCTPSSHRLDILQWLCSRIYPPVQEQLSSLKESQTDTKVKEIAKLCFDLMLCHFDDLDLIRGHASPFKQISFIGQLLDVIQYPDTISSNVILESLSHSTEKNVVTCIRENEELLKELFSSPHFQATLSPECNPWPADFKPLLNAEESLQKRATQSSKGKDMSNSVEALLEISSSLKALKEECVDLCSSVTDGDKVIQSLRLALTDFHQLTIAFNQIYANEFQEHCGHPAPHMSPMGPFFQFVHQSLSTCFKELESIAQFTETSENIVDVVRERHQSKEKWAGSTISTLCEKMKELRQSYEAFQQSSLQD
ncbi:HAUS augmin like complex subunit 7 S homeolog [Xenopus laevis]|uniref:HAUS augmin like complex subunit 7 S homeolog n=1 Tax=Xenopus laevis TaxID=8355 RepID=B1H1T5_XENLA|nr:HAUS augmin like complex subunit 7 S homeolog [Xenopus laevis]AAI60731.1 LOC100158301 protein [Xenopus laevis]8AT3_G Chain G, HAUS augmin like complex subunit 7 S homeolog [Xenopus laevis]8AT4_G Chain G, HAUS augmin like complex subunit 7 S homeolog [Xenopus laevis]8FCK_G Chain G, HAUS augmin like complex subunit 7 S homeolog [Xenopus laevis]